MDLQAWCEGSYEAALDLVEKRAADGKTLTEGLKEQGQRLNEWVNARIGAAARTGAASRGKAWWQGATKDPAKLALLGLGAGAGVGAVGSMTRPKGRRRPVSGALLGGLLGGAALGGYGLLRNNMIGKDTPQENLNKIDRVVQTKAEDQQIAEKAKSVLDLPSALGADARGTAEAIGRGDFPEAARRGGRLIGNADVAGVGEFTDLSGRNNDWAPTTFLNAAVGKAVDRVGRNLPGSDNLLSRQGNVDLPGPVPLGLGFDAGGAVRPGEAEAVKDLLRVGSINPAAEAAILAGVGDLGLSYRARSTRFNPEFLRRGLSGKGGIDILTNNLPGAAPGTVDTVRKHLTDAANFRDRPRALLKAVTPHRGTWTPAAPKDLRTALGGRFLGLGGGMDVPAPGAPAGAPPLARVPAPVLRQVAEVGRTATLADPAVPARTGVTGFLRSGYGTAAQGRLGDGLIRKIPRGAVYFGPSTALHWFRTQADKYTQAQKEHAEAQAQRATAAQVVDASKSPDRATRLVGRDANKLVTGGDWDGARSFLGRLKPPEPPAPALPALPPLPGN